MRRDGTNGSEESAAASGSAHNGASNGTSSSSHDKASILNVLNGSSNGKARSNGASHDTMEGVRLPVSRNESPTFYGHDREEVARILIQGLHDLGYGQAAEKLSVESGFDLETRYASAFREAILDGDWAKAEALLSDTHATEVGGVGTRNGSGSNGHSSQDTTPKGHVQHVQAGLPLSEDADKGEMLFWIRRQKYLELLEGGIETGSLNDALAVLRQQLQPLHQDERQLHALSSLIMCTSIEELRDQAEWDGADGQSRKLLLSELSRSISPSVMIPEHRLANLLTQVKDNQVLNCLYHNSAEWPSLYHDHRCEHDQLPLQTLFELDQHEDEVWYLQFSHDGTRLASAGKDTKVYIYDTENFKVTKILSDHKQPVAYLSWSPDDTRLVTCSQDKTARIWDTLTGLCKRRLDWHQSVVTTASWTHDGSMFATGSHDVDRPLCLWSRDARSSSPTHTFTDLKRVQDCAISAPTAYGPYGHDDMDSPTRPARLVAVCVDKSVHVFDIARREKLAKFDLPYQVTCLNLSTDGMEMLVNLGDKNLGNEEVWAIDLDTGEPRQRFKGQKQGNFVIRSCFGGASEGFVVSGGEDSKISIWHRHTGALLEKFPAHRSGCVNAVAWNTAKPYMFASAGDDACVRIWASKAAMATYQQRTAQSSRSSRQLKPEGLEAAMSAQAADASDANDVAGRQHWAAGVAPPGMTGTSSSHGPPSWGGGGLGGGLGALPSLGRR